MFHLQHRQPVKLLLPALEVGTLQCQLSKRCFPQGMAAGHRRGVRVQHRGGFLLCPLGLQQRSGGIPMGREVGRCPSFRAADGTSVVAVESSAATARTQAEARDSHVPWDEDKQLGKQTGPQGSGGTWGWFPLRFPSTVHNCLEAL